MEYRPYLLFKLGGGQYGIAAHLVQELFLLPALTPIPEATAETVGILNLRGQIIPVIDLKQRLGKQRQPYSLKQVVILIALEHQVIGAIVDEVQNVEFIAESDVALDFNAHLTTRAEHALTAGLAKHDSQLVTLLNPTALMRAAIAPAAPQAESVTITSGDEFLSQFSAADQAMLKGRADGLMAQNADDSSSGLTAFAVVGLQGEYFALSLDTIQEFTDVSQITPVPCCPRHIVGNVNLRGEILTLVDIRQFVNLDPSSGRQHRQAVIVRVDQLVAGIIVDEVFDVAYVHQSEISATPTAIHSAENEYIRGVSSYGEKMMSILDLPKLLTHGEMIVDQAA